MFWLRNISIVVCAVSITGCATHPLPKQVTRDTTLSIVEKIHCEAREALDNISIALLRRSDQPATLRFADRIENGTMFVRDFEKVEYGRLLDPRVIGELQVFTLSSVVFDFRFDITVTNDNSITANFLRPILQPLGSFTLGLNAGKKLMRQNERKFQIGTTFYLLHQERFDAENCSDIVARHRHIIYPITGKIGLEEVFDTFVGLSGLSGGLGTGNDPQNKTKKFIDKLTFTTTLNAKATPKLTLTPISDPRFRLADISGSFESKRSDIHEVSISVAKGEFFKTKGLNTARADGLKRAFFNADLERFEQTQRTIFDNQDRLDSAGF